MKEKLLTGRMLFAVIVLTLLAVTLFAGSTTPALPEDDPEMRDHIRCWQGPGEKKLWRSLTDGLVEVTDAGVIRFSNNGNERVLINMECRVTYDVAPVQ